MIEITRSDEELILDDQIDVVQQLQRRVEMIGHKANKAIEDLRRPAVYQGQTIYRAQALASFGVCYQGLVGTGTARLCILIGNQWYWRYPHRDVPNIANDFGDLITTNMVLWITQVDGRWSVMRTDCQGGTTVALSDQPH